jgi:hypothetical protein
MTSNELTLDICEKFLYCHELLNLKSNKKSIKRRQPKPIQLTSEEIILFNEEELLSAYQNVIANTSGEHRNRSQVLFISNRVICLEPISSLPTGPNYGLVLDHVLKRPSERGK